MENYAQLPELSNKMLIANLIREIRQRVVDLYESTSLNFKRIICISDYEHELMNNTKNFLLNVCERGSFIIGLGTDIESLAPCGSIMSNRFNGCTAIFCIV